MTEIKKVLVAYKLFTVTFVAMLVLLLIRVPLGTFNIASPIDTIAHFVLPAFGAPFIAMILQEMHLFPKLKTVPLIIFIILLGITLEVLWEIFEFCVDISFGVSWQLGNSDTMIDLILAVCGATLGALFFARLYRTSL